MPRSQPTGLRTSLAGLDADTTKIAYITCLPERPITHPSSAGCPDLSVYGHSPPANCVPSISKRAFGQINPRLAQATALLQPIFAPPAVAALASQEQPTLAPSATGRSKKRLRGDSDELKPKKVTVRVRQNSGKPTPRVKAIRKSDQLLPESSRGDDAGSVHQQHAEDEPCGSIPEGSTQ